MQLSGMSRGGRGVLLPVCFLGLLVLASGVRVLIVQGDSMAPTLANGSMWLLDRNCPRSHPVRRGDVVLFEREGQAYVKRVRAVAGDVLPVSRLRGDTMLDVLSPRGYRSLSRSTHGRRRRPYTVSLLRVPDGCCFVLGDNPGVSEDSRAFGPISLACVSGRLINAPRSAAGDSYGLLSSGLGL